MDLALYLLHSCKLVEGYITGCIYNVIKIYLYALIIRLQKYLVRGHVLSVFEEIGARESKSNCEHQQINNTNTFGTLFLE